jgi:hypothetical protein
MYQKDLLKDWSCHHLKKCGWYLDCPMGYASSFEVSLCESLELGFTEKVIENCMSQAPKKSKDTTKKKAKENLVTSKSMVNIERPHITNFGYPSGSTIYLGF